MKRFNLIIVGLAVLATLSSCSDSFLNSNPKGTVSGEQLNTPERTDQMVTVAYASLGNDHWTAPYSNLWSSGSVRSDDAYKGGGGTGDVAEVNQYEQFSFVTPDIGRADAIWYELYVGISRTNDALSRLNNLEEGEFALKTRRQAEMRFLRGHFHFVLKKLFKRVPYINETIPEDSLATVSNRRYSNDELWNKIAEDFAFAAENLPESQQDVGRPNTYTAKAYLAKVRLYQAYEQDEQHNVVNINTERLQDVFDLTSEVINSGQYALHDDFAKNFLWEFENGEESVFAVQNSIDDGTPNGRLDMANGLNYNMASDYGCCWFHIPSQNLVNAFKTDDSGLPMFDSFNNADMNEPAEFQENSVDPRLDHTVGIPTHPFKYDPNFVYQEGWARTPSVYGYYSTMKETQHPDSPSLKAVGPFFASSKNTIIIRYADVLLWKAEALIELGRQGEALPIINQIRERAQNSRERLRNADGEYVSNYGIETYEPGVNIQWTQENAREALRWERRLEFAMEGSRFFDLVRWGIAADVLNTYFEEEKTKRSYLQDAHFQENRDEYWPIPQQQIDFSNGLYEQNYGWN
ncbi:RagB/SusD family nutrient uptake outer membrane protein [Fodinibius salsisoli]|uniref:RagB/SusD family nutrient uptake outer membrane protein n=1 Tax=Fodinibius salsisoli TaxID=2820877 RepID=A0ABT3PPY6_9BACT|nr:RagB/SusD family nutrient uptake outer membrane protein [Fodinibius salsisoli]MCW9707895.1 RagB/SusD family nutrient uptake outer membrane protein [Fodinibius salsisoli]